MRRLAIAVVGITMFSSVAGAAEPALTVHAEQEAERPANFTGVPVWQPVWWVVIDAHSQGAPLARVEYRANYDDGQRRTISGGWDLKAKDSETLAVRLRVRCERLVDYDRQVHVKVRVIDTDGQKSAWETADFPVRGGNTSAVAAPAKASAPPAKVIGSVSYLAADDVGMGVVRENLERQARSQGGSGIQNLHLEPAGDGQTRFIAEVVEIPPTAVAAAATPLPSLNARRILGEIKMRSALR